MGSAAHGSDNQRGGEARCSPKNCALPRSVTTGAGPQGADLHQSCDFDGTPRMSFDAWTALSDRASATGRKLPNPGPSPHGASSQCAPVPVKVSHWLTTGGRPNSPCSVDSSCI